MLAALLEAAIAGVYLEHGFEQIEPAIVEAFILGSSTRSTRTSTTRRSCRSSSRGAADRFVHDAERRGPAARPVVHRRRGDRRARSSAPASGASKKDAEQHAAARGARGAQCGSRRCRLCVSTDGLIPRPQRARSPLPDGREDAQPKRLFRATRDGAAGVRFQSRRDRRRVDDRDSPSRRARSARGRARRRDRGRRTRSGRRYRRSSSHRSRTGHGRIARARRLHRRRRWWATLVGEHVERAVDEPRDPVRMTAGAAAVYLRRPAARAAVRPVRRRRRAARARRRSPAGRARTARTGRRSRLPGSARRGRTRPRPQASCGKATIAPAPRPSGREQQRCRRPRGHASSEVAADEQRRRARSRPPARRTSSRQSGVPSATS